MLGYTVISSRKDGSAVRTLGNAYLLALFARGAEAAFFLSLFSAFSVAQVGLYSWGIAVSAFFAIAIDLGLNQVLVRDFSRGSIGIGFAVMGSLLLRAPLIAAAAVFALVWAEYWKPATEAFRVVLLASLIQLLTAAEGFCFAWLKSHHRQSVANALGTLDPVGRLVVFAVVYSLLHIDSAVGLLAGIAVWHVPLFLSCAFTVRRALRWERPYPVRSVSWDSIKDRLLLPGMTFGGIGLITVLQNRMDWLLVAHYAGQVELANYSVANKCYETVLLMAGIAMLTVYPWLCSGPARPVFMRRLNIITTGVLAAGVSAALGAGLYLPTMLDWVWGDKYASAYGFIQILLPIAAVSIAIMILYYRLIAKGLEASLLKASAVVTVLQLTVNLAMIPLYGANGAIAGMAVLAFFNLAYYLVTATRLGVLHGQAAARQVVYILIMALTAAALRLVPLSVPAGLATLFAVGLIGWFTVLLPLRERQWVRVYLGRIRHRVARQRGLV